PLSSTPITFQRTNPEPNMDPTLWAYAPQGWVMRGSTTAIAAKDTSASVTFRITETCRRQSCALRLDAAAPDDLIARVNDIPAEVTVTTNPGTTGRGASTAGFGPVDIRLPPGAADVWVSLARRSGQPLDLQVQSIGLTPVSDKD
ncbi:MAG: hypothetical protein ACRCYU_08700, partial [Nocardioides sp.]